MGRGGTPNLIHTCRNICVTFLATSTIPVCRWIASEDNLADEPSCSKRYRPNMHFDVDQCVSSATESAPDSELFAVLSAEAARVASAETQTRQVSRVRSCVSLADQSRGRMETGRKTTRGKTTCTNSGPRCSGESGLSAPLFGESSFFEQNRVTAATVQRYTVTLNEFLASARRMLDEQKLLPKLDEMVVLEHLYFQSHGRGAGDCLMAAVKFVGWIQSFSDVHRAVRALKEYRWLAPGMSRGPLPWVAAAAMMVWQWWRKTSSLQ